MRQAFLPPIFLVNLEVGVLLPAIEYHDFIHPNALSFQTRGVNMLDGWFLWFILIWIFALPVLFGIGGFFMFRKFLKKLPKEDGKSDMDWEIYYVEHTKHLWTEEQLALLNELVSPVPELFRDVARHKIQGKIGELALKEHAKKITLDLIIRGYIIATPKRDHKYLRKKLEQLNIRTESYEQLFQ